MKAQFEEDVSKGGRTDVVPALAPDAKRALLAAYDESWALGSSYIRPEHVLLALTLYEESEAGQATLAFRALAHQAAGSSRTRGRGRRRAREPGQLHAHPR